MGAKKLNKKLLRTDPTPVDVPGISSRSPAPSTKLEPRWILTSDLEKTPMAVSPSSQPTGSVILDTISKRPMEKFLRTGPIPVAVPVTIFGISSLFKGKDGSPPPSTKLEPRWILTSDLEEAFNPIAVSSKDRCISTSASGKTPYPLAVSASSLPSKLTRSSDKRRSSLPSKDKKKVKVVYDKVCYIQAKHPGADSGADSYRTRCIIS